MGQKLQLLSPSGNLSLVSNAIILSALLAAYFVNNPVTVNAFDIPKHGIKIPAVVRKHIIGTLYNASTSQFYETIPLWGKIPEECIQIIPINHTYFDATLISSARDQLASITLDAETQLSILSGMVQVDGKLSTEWAQQSRVKQIESLVLAQRTTFELKLHINCNGFVKELIREQLESTNANYMVTSIVLGVRYTVRFKSTEVFDTTGSTVGGSISSKVEKLAWSLKAALEGASVSKESSDFSDVRVTIDGDVDLPDAFLTDFMTTKRYIDQVNRNITERRKHDNGTALFYIATHVDEIRSLLKIPGTADFYQSVDLKSVEEALNMMNSAERVYNEAIFIDTKLKNHRECYPAKTVNALFPHLMGFTSRYSLFRGSLRKAVAEERRGTEGEVLKVMTQYSQDKYSPENFQEMLEKDFKQYLRMLETAQDLENRGLPCLPTNIIHRSLAPKFVDTVVILLQYRSNYLDYNLEKWSDAIIELSHLCARENGSSVYEVTCFSIDCQHADHLCTDDNAPTARVADAGNFIELGKMTVTDYVCKRSFPPDYFKAQFSCNGRSKFDVMRRSVIKNDIGGVDYKAWFDLWKGITTGTAGLTERDFWNYTKKKELEEPYLRELRDMSCVFYC